MLLYVDSSAALAWLLDEPGAATAGATLNSADRIATSALTLLECSRGLTRARAVGRITREHELSLRHTLDVAALNWDVLDITEDVLATARTEFPVEPVRSQDAIQLATAIQLLRQLGDISMLCFDKRLTANALALGISVLP
jgi:predicted nucleic acid-binding protein